MVVYLNGRFIEDKDAKVSIMDRGFLYGDGVFETLRAYKGFIFKLESHIERLFKGIIYLDIKKIEITYDTLKKILYKLLVINNLNFSDAYIRITITRGIGEGRILSKGYFKPTILIVTTPYKKPPEKFYKNGVKLTIAKRCNWRLSEDADIKYISFLNNILAKMEAEDDSYECIMLNKEGFLTEGTVSNLFFVKNGVIYTPSRDTGILDGITRQTIIDIAKREGIKVLEGYFRIEELIKAEEVFITNTLIEVMPVSRIGEIWFNLGKMSKQLRELYIKEIEKEKDCYGILI